MNDNKRYSLVILILFTVAAIFTIVWGMFLNYGKITVDAQAPFMVNVIAGPSVECEQNPCEIQLKPGLHTVIFQKSGFREVRQDIDVKRWGNSDIKVDFKFIPIIEPVETEDKTKTDDDIVPANAITSYILPDKEDVFYLKEEADGKESLMFKKGKEDKIIAYFPKSLGNPLITASDNGQKVAILEQLDQVNSIYLVDVDASSKDKIFQSAAPIEHFAISPNGQHVAVISDGKTLLIGNDGSSQELSFTVVKKGLAWFGDGKIVVISDTLLTADLQAAAESVVQNNNVAFDDYMKILDAANESTDIIPDEKTLFVYLYDIESESLERLATISGTKNLPVKLEVKNAPATKELFFYDEEENKYQIVLQP